MPGKTPITVAFGDGIGPEIMQATLDIIMAAGAKLDLETIEIGEKVYRRGITSGIEDSSWKSLLKTRVFLKAPITTPQGGGYKSLNVTIRKSLGLFANIRPCTSFHPYVETKHPGMDVVIVRENEEDTYAGIEHRPFGRPVQAVVADLHHLRLHAVGGLGLVQVGAGDGDPQVTDSAGLHLPLEHGPEFVVIEDVVGSGVKLEDINVVGT